MALGLSVQKVYPADATIVHWRGTTIASPEEFELFLRGPVRARVGDTEFEAGLAQDLQALATTEVATATLQSLLVSTPLPLDWEIGEAIAECLLADEFGVRWPWNENRDRKTPKASLPGADLVGIVGNGDDAVFLFGEVKTSSHASNPPGVMAGRSGLSHQIDTLASSTSVHFALLRWLHARCKGTPLWDDYQKACARYLHSGGRDVALVGVLLRDTPPHEDDLRTRGQALAAAAAGQPKVRLDAWYAPRPICDWVTLTLAEAE
jgi:hypothetical protein